MAPATVPNPVLLPHTARGRKGPPIVLLHGFGFDGASWAGLAAPLARMRRTVAFDLPGHGGAGHWAPTPGAAVAAKAVVASLDAMGIARATFVGHSLGGAVAALVGLRRPDLVERLVLLAPGGFGPAMNVAALRRYAHANTAAELASAAAPLFAPGAALPQGFVEALAAARRAPALRQSHAAIVEAISLGEGQGMLPLDALAAAPFPISLVWGLEDAILPASQAIEAAPEFARHLLPGVGHMPHLEAPATVLGILARTIAGRLAEAPPA